MFKKVWHFFNKKTIQQNYSCFAPWTSMSFNIDGTVTACCLNRKSSVSIESRTIDEIWNSEAFVSLRNHVKSNDLNYDCQICLSKIQNNNTESIKARDYDKYAPISSFPKVMEFALENTCNLSCKMCNSFLSSSIRKEKGLPPLKKYYNDNFVKQLEKYIPHLQEAIFAGGEPFLIPLYYKIWDKILEINPKVKISVVTNGTVLNSRIKELLKKGNFNLNISIDSVDKETYLSIRKNANYDKLMENFEWFNKYVQLKNQKINIPICPMTYNWKKIPETVQFANENDATINFVHVDRPIHASIKYADLQTLEAIIHYYKLYNFKEKNNSVTKKNIAKFKELINDIASWKENDTSLENRNNQNIEKWKELAIEKFGESNNVIVQNITEIVNKKHPVEQSIITSKIIQLSTDRFNQVFEGKSQEEIKIIFEEYV